MTLVRLPTPKTAEDFERIALSIVRHVWQDPTAMLLGRSGQAQHGIDAFGRARHLNGQPAAAQFRNKDKLTVREVEQALAAMDAGLPPPVPGLFMVVTRSSRDAPLQLRLRELSHERSQAGLSELVVVFWEDIEEIVIVNEVMLRQHYPDLTPRRLGPAEEARLRAQNAVVVRLVDGGSGFDGVEGRAMLGCTVINDGETPFTVVDAAAEWWFTDEFLEIEPTYPSGRRGADTKIMQPRAAPGLGASVNVYMDSGPTDNSRLWVSLNQARSVVPLRASLTVKVANAAGTCEQREIDLAWPLRKQ